MISMKRGSSDMGAAVYQPSPRSINRGAQPSVWHHRRQRRCTYSAMRVAIMKAGWES
jgi:hypothetical protein